MKLRLGKPSPSMIVAMLALFVALGGTSFAAVTLARNSVGTPQLKKNAVVSSKVKNGSLLGADFKAGQLPAGPQGPAGPSTGAAGGDLRGSYPNPTIADGAVTPAKLQAPGGFTSVGLPLSTGFCGAGDLGWYEVSPDVNNSVSYYRDPYGTVHLRGIPQRCGAATGDTAFTLPAGYRPGSEELQLALFSTDSGRFAIRPDGSVSTGALSAGMWMSLDGHSFRCAPSGTGGCP